MRNVVVAQFVVILQCLREGTEKTMKSFSIPGIGVDIWKSPTTHPQQIQTRWTKCIILVVLTGHSCVFKMGVIAVRPREILIYVFFCALSLLITKPKLRKETQTQNHVSSDSHPRGRQWSSDVCSYAILCLPILSFSLFSEMLLVC